MTTEATSGAPGGAPSGNAAAAPSNPAPVPAEFDRGTPSAFVRARVDQMTTPQSAPSDNAPAPDARQPQQQQQQTPSAEKVHGEYTAAEIDAAFAFKAEADIRKSGLPKTPEAFEAKLSPGFQPPVDGARFEIDANSPALANARKVALKHGLSQEAFSDFLDVFAADKIGEQAGVFRARETNLQQLGAAGPQRINAVATWLRSIAGRDGADVANFITRFPSAPIVRSLETVIRRFSSQGGADFSQSGRAQQEEQGKIPGYENMSFVQKRAIQMAQMLSRQGYRGGGDRRE